MNLMCELHERRLSVYADIDLELKKYNVPYARCALRQPNDLQT